VNEPLAHDLTELLRHANADSLADLSAQVDDHAEMDAGVPALQDQDALPAGLLVRVADLGSVLEFPFALSALFSLVNELEADLEQRWDELETAE
jgi:hypothetical protein